MTNNILVIGSDKRQYYCFKRLAAEGFSACRISGLHDITQNMEAFKTSIKNYSHLICPIPFTRDGKTISGTEGPDGSPISIAFFTALLSENQRLISYNIPWNVKTELIGKGIKVYDLSESEAYKYVNSRLTAEGLLKYILEDIPFSLSGAEVLIAGYGSSGRAIARILSGLNSHITVFNRSKAPLLMAESLGFKTVKKLEAPFSIADYDIIVNTVPSVIFNKEHLIEARSPLYIFDIASNPGGFDLSSVNDDIIKYRSLPGIPGKVFPMSAANIICDLIKENTL